MATRAGSAKAKRSAAAARKAAEAAPVCARYHHAVELIGRRWTGAILRVLLGGPTRFSDIAGTVPGLSDRLLSERLKELEAEGIVVRTVFPETPVRIEYALTEKGLALEGVIAAVADWAETWACQPAADVERAVHDGDRSEEARARELAAAPAGD